MLRRCTLQATYVAWRTMIPFSFAMMEFIQGIIYGIWISRYLTTVKGSVACIMHYCRHAMVHGTDTVEFDIPVSCHWQQYHNAA